MLSLSNIARHYLLTTNASRAPEYYSSHFLPREEMLKADGAEDNPVDVPVAERAAEMFGESRSSLVAGQQLGAYLIVREKGRGGMGEASITVSVRQPT
jgi:hypothetical protein